MAREYRILIGWLIVFMLMPLVEESPIVWYLIFMSIISLYSLYRHSTVFQKFRFKGKRYFIKSSHDKPYSDKDFYVGVVLLILGIVYFTIRSNFDLSAYLDAVIISSLIAFGLMRILSRLFLTALPTTELLIKDYSVEVIRKGSLLKEIDDLTAFKINQESITMISDTKNFELSDLELTDEQVIQLSKEFESLIDTFKKTTEIRKDSLKNLKRYFSIKRSKA